jgi:hypothetical protein
MHMISNELDKHNEDKNEKLKESYVDYINPTNDNLPENIIVKKSIISKFVGWFRK